MAQAKICSIFKNELVREDDDGQVVDRTDIFYLDAEWLTGKDKGSRVVVEVPGPTATDLMFVQAEGRPIELALSPKGKFKAYTV